jgi:hypothetical protein
MNLDSVTVHIRPRTSWEAIDIGFALARRWFFKLWPLWLMTALPALALIVGCSFLLPGSAAKWTLFLFWFFKPLYEPPLLNWSGQALFGSEKPLARAIGEVRSVLTAKDLRSVLFSRFSLFRSFSLPVLQLEKLEGPKKKERLAILRDGSSTAILLTVGGFCMEVVLTMSLLSVIFWFIPEKLRWINFGDFVFTPDKWLLVFSYVASCSILAPIYICSGFMMYISRRVELEAWDIEIGFKRLRQRLEQQKSSLARNGAMIIMLCTFVVTGLATTGRAAVPDPQTVKTTITEVLAQKVFGEKETRYHWVSKKKEDTKPASPWSEIWKQLFTYLAVLMKKIIPYLARYGEFILWCGMGILIAFLLLKSVRLREWLSGNAFISTGRPEQSQVMFGMDLRPESLPDNVGRSCFLLLDDGRTREAISLLYRGTLSGLIHRGHLDIHPSSTEKECSGEVRRHRPAPEASFFDRLTGLWIYIAYGHRKPEVEACREIVSQWQDLFGEKP